MPKIISECYELVKLCDINCSGPFFLDALYVFCSHGSACCDRVREFYWVNIPRTMTGIFAE